MAAREIAKRREGAKSLPAGLTLLVGPARSGKTTRLLDVYREVLGVAPPGAALWLCPTARAAAATRAALVGAELPACLSPGVMTFDGFASSVLRGAAEAVRPIGPVQVRQLLERLASEASRGGELEYFGPIAHTAGFVERLAQFIAELKRLEIWPEQYAEVCRQRRRGRKDRELALLYGRYQQWLNRGRLYDAEGRFWWARTLLREAAESAPPRYQIVVADGFADFTHTQHEILELLASRAEHVFVSLPLELEGDRHDLFRKSRETLDVFRRRHPSLRIEKLPALGGAGADALAHLERELFRSPRRQHPAEPSDCIEILAAAGQLNELEEIARSIKRLLLQGDPSDGNQPVRPDDVVVAIRGLGELGPLVTEVFHEYGLPLALEAAPALESVPAIAALLGLLRLEIGGWEIDDLLAVIGNAYFRPRWPEWRGGQTAMDVDWIVRDLQIPAGRELLCGQIARWGKDEPADAGAALPEGDEPAAVDVAAAAAQRQLAQRRRHARRALPLVERLAAVLARLPQAATATQWVAALESLAGEIDFDAALADDPSDRDRQAWQRLLATVAEEDELSALLEQPLRQWTGRQFVDLLGELCRWERLPGGGSEAGRVRVLSAESVRGLPVRYLYFAGLSEGSFPQHREPAWHGRGEIDLLRGAGLRFDPPMDRGEDEMLLFYEVLTRATRRLYLSYPALDNAAQPLLPSPYLTEVERACGADRIVRRQLALSQAVVQSGPPLSPRELRAMAVAGALKGSPELLATTLRQNDEFAANVRAAWRAGASREERIDFGPFEGLIRGQRAVEVLSQQFGDEHCWTASSLEQYAYCPYQFFLRQVLGIEPLADLRLEIDYLERGRVLHDALAAAYRRLASNRGDPAIEQPAIFRQEFTRAIDEQFARRDDANPLTPAWRAIDRRVLLRWCNNYLEQAAKRADKRGDRETSLVPAHFEVSFGIASEADRPPSVADPLRLVDGAESLLLRGRIDRIDVGVERGQTLLAVVDYKGSTGKSTKPNAALEPSELQADLYAVAAAELILAGRRAVPVASGYWYLRSGGYVPKFLEGAPGACETFAKRRQRLVEIVFELARGARRGDFPVYCADEDCKGRCEFHTVCRVNQIRALEKVWPIPDPSAD